MDLKMLGGASQVSTGRLPTILCSHTCSSAAGSLEQQSAFGKDLLDWRALWVVLCCPPQGPPIL